MVHDIVVNAYAYFNRMCYCFQFRVFQKLLHVLARFIATFIKKDKVEYAYFIIPRFRAYYVTLLKGFEAKPAQTLSVY